MKIKSPTFLALRIIVLLVALLSLSSVSRADERPISIFGTASPFSCELPDVPGSAPVFKKNGKVIHLQATIKKFTRLSATLAAKLKAQKKEAAKLKKKGGASYQKALSAAAKTNTALLNAKETLRLLKACRDQNKFQLPLCGNGLLETGEDCDDISGSPLSCCSQSCKFKAAGSACGQTNVCSGFSCNGAGSCVPGPVNGSCDDGNSCTANDTCAQGVCIGQKLTSGNTSCGVGECLRSVQSCINGVSQSCTPGTPTAEVCNGKDDDCNGSIDDGLGTISCGVGACKRTVQACINGVSQICTPGLPSTEVCNGIDDNCDGQIDEITASDPHNCGGCGNVCTGGQVCNNGICGLLQCSPGFANCDIDSSNGCEVTLGSDINNCGGCGVVCAQPAHATRSCLNGVCGLGQCSVGFADCDNNSADGCEASLSNDKNNCGSCGNVCNLPHAGEGCSSGACTITSCDPQYSDCDGLVEDGCETLIGGSDINNCGGCGVTCSRQNAQVACSTGICQLAACNNGFCNGDSNSANGCETILDQNPSCAGATDLGSIKGNTGAESKVVQNFGEKIYSLTVQEDILDITLGQLLADITLTPTGGTDYDLDVWCQNCGNTPFSSELGVGQSDHLTIGRDNTLLTDSTFLIFIRVKFFSGNSCAPWQLVVNGHSGVRTSTCQ